MQRLERRWLLPPELTADDQGRFLHPSRTVSAKLQNLYKSMFFFLRAYHDTLYRAIREMQGQRAGKYGSMSKALNEANSVRFLLDERLPEFIGWFADWRDKRNLIKEGVNFSIAGPQTNPGITFTRVDPRTGGITVDVSQGIRLAEITEALVRTTELMALVTDFAMEHDTYTRRR